MRFGLSSIGVICLLGAAYLWMTGDPWSHATSKASADAHAVYEVQARPDRIGFYLLQDPALLKAVVWSPNGSVSYPGPSTFVLPHFDLSLEELQDLTRRTAETPQARWSSYDRDGTQLLYCQSDPQVCLIYDRAKLQTDLQVTLNGVHRGIIGVLAALGALSLVLAWRHGSAAEPDDQLVLLPEHHSARRGTLEVSLTPRDMRLLEFLQTKQGIVVTKDELYDAGWGRDFMPNSRALDQHMINLRKKLDPDKSRPPVIETVRGVGYRLLN